MSFPGVMLASPTSVLAPSVPQAIDLLAGRDTWVHDLKADGIRALVTVTAYGVAIVNRTGATITWRYPDVVDAVWAAQPPHGVYDGEIVVVREGKIDFPGIHRRDAQGSADKAARLAETLPASFLAFDMLQARDVDLTASPLSIRRAHLIASGMPAVPSTDDLRALWAVVQDQNLEGIVSKRLDSHYVPRRSRSWVKLKRTKTLSAIVVGYVEGRGQRANTLGALDLALLNSNGQLVPIGSVGSGFTLKDLEELAATRDTGIVVDVTYLDVSPDGKLRQPVFSHVRRDVPLTDCTTAQLRG